jgi:hypothetical protein
MYEASFPRASATTQPQGLAVRGVTQRLVGRVCRHTSHVDDEAPSGAKEVLNLKVPLAIRGQPCERAKLPPRPKTRLPHEALHHHARESVVPDRPLLTIE